MAVGAIVGFIATKDPALAGLAGVKKELTSYTLFMIIT